MGKCRYLLISGVALGQDGHNFSEAGTNVSLLFRLSLQGMNSTEISENIIKVLQKMSKHLL
jgi:hypothetical protein